MPRLLVVNCAALSFDLATRGDTVNEIADLMADGGIAPVEPVFPALAMPNQASLITGRPPSDHGIVMNGVFDRELGALTAGAQGLDPFWESPEVKASRVAMLSWPCRVAGAEVRSAAGTASKMVSHVRRVLSEDKPDLGFVRLSDLEEPTERKGPSSSDVVSVLESVDAAVGELREAARSIGAEMVVLSEYAPLRVERSIDPNAALRECGLQDDGPPFRSRAFAVVDHQVAHVFCREGAASAAADALRGLGCAVYATPEEKMERAVDHARSGDLVVEAPEGAWFGPAWWLGGGFSVRSDQAPPALAASHGRMPRKNEERPVIISSVPVEGLKPGSPVAVTDIPAILTRILNG